MRPDVHDGCSIMRASNMLHCSTLAACCVLGVSMMAWASEGKRSKVGKVNMSFCNWRACALQLVSTALTIALLGGAAWFYFQYGGSSSSNGDSSKQSSSSSQDVDLNDPLAEARRIMDKYKN